MLNWFLSVSSPAGVRAEFSFPSERKKKSQKWALGLLGAWNEKMQKCCIDALEQRLRWLHHRRWCFFFFFLVKQQEQPRWVRQMFLNVISVWQQQWLTFQTNKQTNKKNQSPMTDKTPPSVHLMWWRPEDLQPSSDCSQNCCSRRTSRPISSFFKLLGD